MQDWNHVKCACMVRMYNIITIYAIFIPVDFICPLFQFSSPQHPIIIFHFHLYYLLSKIGYRVAIYRDQINIVHVHRIIAASHIQNPIHIIWIICIYIPCQLRISIVRRYIIQSVDCITSNFQGENIAFMLNNIVSFIN